MAHKVVSVNRDEVILLSGYVGRGRVQTRNRSYFCTSFCFFFLVRERNGKDILRSERVKYARLWYNTHRQRERRKYATESTQENEIAKDGSWRIAGGGAAKPAGATNPGGTKTRKHRMRRVCV